MSAYRIRHAEPRDAEALNAVFSDPATFSTMLGLPYPALNKRRERLQKHESGRTVLVAVDAADQAVGWAALVPARRERLLRTAEIGIGIASALHGQGVGSLLMAAALDLADNWQGLRRIELTVFADNPRAQALYRKFGFVEEARLRAYALRDGVYHDVLAMARLREGGWP
ncbi:GNAT family N-acetyltransferase [Chromobacterium alticapitis]|uniref:GNAT family N-acetyltransferase n=1 Tax=Chromobacterium alticapitis TaxID=2073169 RepID=A0A2S5DLS4_9NEIS|nr:GNAT family N-acetyltransferase [Chromobacterium alticapitis]POZ64003.1 GNAT family N-acetyltransferase [Chromobacterium alticapitis]